MSIDVQAEELIEIIAGHLRRRRDELGLSQAQVVERINVLRRKRLKKGEKLRLVYIPYLSDMERGKRAPHVENLVELAEVLETTHEALVASPEKISV